MDKEIFVQNIKKYCTLKGVRPTNACKEAGVGGSYISDINRGRTPSISSVQMLAEYLEVTTSQLLGEGPPSASGVDLSAAELDLLDAYRAADDRAKDMVALALEPWIQSKKKGKAI